MTPDTCDFCDAPLTNGKWRLITPRPSDPHELVDTMCACETCGKENNFTSPNEIKEMVQKIEDGTLIINGKPIIFYTFS